MPPFRERQGLKRVRPETHEEDWNRIQDIHNLEDFAHRLLLLNMIVKSLHKLEKCKGITAASLCEVYTDYWMEREKEKGRILDRKTKLTLMTELSWKLWNEEKNGIHYKELILFLKGLIDPRHPGHSMVRYAGALVSTR